jgi:hypothetical protein
VEAPTLMLRPNAPQDAETAALEQATAEASRKSDSKPWVRAKRIFVTLANGTVTVPHGLKRKPAGWMLHTVLGTAHAFVPVAPDTANITITAIAVGSCVLEVW